MIKALSSLALASLLFWGCSADPGNYKVPKRDRKLVKNGSLVSFTPKIDVLFIIDDSGSMREHQRNYSTNIGEFIKIISKSRFIDYHIGVTTSSEFDTTSKADQGQLMEYSGYRYVDRNNPDVISVLSELIKVGLRGDTTEKFLSIPELVFTEPNLSGFNAGFYRPEAQLAIFYITDTYDQTRLEASDTYDFLVGLKNGDPRKVHIAGAIIDQIVTTGCSRDENRMPVKLLELIQLAGLNGSLFELCSQNYGPNLAQVAESIVDSVSTVFLDRLPDIRTIRVSLGDEEIPQGPDGWSYNAEENSIRISPKLNITTTDASKLNIFFEDVFAPKN